MAKSKTPIAGATRSARAAQRASEASAKASAAPAASKPRAKAPAPAVVKAAKGPAPDQPMAAPAPAPAPTNRSAAAAEAGVSAAAPRASEPAAPSPSSLPGWPELLSPDQRQAMETLALNLARASMTAQTAMAGAAAQAPPPQVDPFHSAPAMTEVATRLAADPQKLVAAQAQLFERYMDLWKVTAGKITGEDTQPAIAPAKNDKRFRDADWSDNPVFDVMKQSYLISSEWLNGLVGQVEGVDPMTKRRAEFFTKVMTDAFSPSNYLLTNPAALREAVSSQGQSLVRGAENFAADLARGGGQLSISQTDAEKFKVGENVATAPGKVVFQNELFQLLQFSPSTDKGP